MTNTLYEPESAVDPAPVWWSEEERDAMVHKEAIEMMASERYLLDELSPELRESYEDHLFSCKECASDALLGAAFVGRAKSILPTLPDERPSALRSPWKVERDWFGWLRPAIMVPFFASLLAIVGYQNLVTVPALQLAANEPRILPLATVLHGETRGGAPVVHADAVMGSAITVEMPQSAAFESYRFDVYNSKAELVWTRAMQSAAPAEDTVTILLPGRFKPDSYKLDLSGMTSTGEHVAIQQQFFELQTTR